jgi:hypothetical protein
MPAYIDEKLPTPYLYNGHRERHLPARGLARRERLCSLYGKAEELTNAKTTL